jgi:hypothetical protein
MMITNHQKYKNLVFERDKMGCLAYNGTRTSSLNPVSKK